MKFDPLVPIIAACGVLFSVSALSQPFPSKPLRVIIPTAPGGGNDIMARIVSQKLGERLKLAVIVDNRAGGNGAIASEYVARAAPDGYTTLFGYIATHGINPALQKLNYDAVKDFSPIGQISEAQGVLVVHPGLPVNSVKELIAFAKAKPMSLNYASAGSGTAPHISAEEFKLRTGIDIAHIPYKGSAPGVTDTLAGQTQLMFPSLVAAMQHIKTGKLRALAVTGKNRSPLFQSLPTIAESGVPGFDVTQWYGFFAPAKTPREVVLRWHTEILAVMKDPDTVKKFAEQGADVVTTSPEEFGRFVQSEIEKWTKVVKAANITAG